MQDLHDIWDWVLTEKLHLPPRDRNLYAAILVLPETFDNRGMLSDCIFPLLLDNVDEMFNSIPKRSSFCSVGPNYLEWNAWILSHHLTLCKAGLFVPFNIL